MNRKYTTYNDILANNSAKTIDNSAKKTGNDGIIKDGFTNADDPKKSKPKEENDPQGTVNEANTSGANYQNYDIGSGRETPLEGSDHKSEQITGGDSAKKNSETKNSALTHAEKAQKAAIMARNMSHNLGSHVMAYLKQQLYTTESILSSQDHVLYDIYDGTKENKPDYANLQLPFLVGLGQFINYLQERQDYIATVATSYIPYPSPIDFKEAIFDGINPDLKWLRHWKPNNQSNKPFNILLNYIAKSEGYTRQPIEYGQKSSNEGRYLQINYIDYNLENDKPVKIDGFSSKSMESAQGTNSISLAIPGGLIGRQAVFSIIENITRNAAKHEKVGNENLEINIGLIDGSKLNKYKEKGWISEEIYDCYSKADDIHNLYLFLITYKTNTKDDSLVLESLWKGINEKYVRVVKSTEASNRYYIQFIETNKGIKEVRISASWLRGDTDENNYVGCFFNENSAIIQASNNEERGNKAPLVYVDIQDVSYKDKDDNIEVVKSIRYIFGIKKQLGVRFLTDNKSKSSVISFIKDNEINGWCVKPFNLDEAKKDEGCYEFVVVEKDEDYDKLRPYYNSRLIKWSDCEKYYAKLQNELDNISNDDQIKKGRIILGMLFSVYTNVSWLDAIEDAKKINIWDFEAYDYAYYEPNKDNQGNKIKRNEPLNTFPKGVDLLDSDPSIRNSRYIYRTHHDSQAKDFIEKKIKTNELFRNVRVEGISGANSTTRLVRYSPEFNYIWYCKHLHALSQNIAIIDERIFESVTGLSEQDFIDYSEGDRNVIQRLATSIDYDTDMFILSEDNKSIFVRHPQLENINQSQINDYLKTIHSSRGQMRTIMDGNQIPSSVLLSQKGIWLFNIIPSDSEQTLMLVGYYHDVENNQTHYFEIASITKKREGVGIIIESKCSDYFNKILPNGGKFDSLTIHQGILDKLYGFAGCKTEDDQKNITLELYKYFIDRRLSDKNKMYGLFIHSGRSKPSPESMPQHVPFIQFSALDFAIHDSKYTLVELLDFAKYEDKN